MARPVQANAEATRRRILDAALRLFSERGSEVSIRDIAQASGITLATVHHYFGSKEQLYRACIEAMYVELEALRTELEPAIVTGGTPRALVEHTVRVSFRFAWAHRGAIRLLMRDVIDAGQLEPERRSAVHIPFLERGGKTLAAMLGREEIEMRLAIQTLMHLIVRYALSSEDELCMLTGLQAPPAASGVHPWPQSARTPRALAAIEAHLTSLALALTSTKEPA